MVTDSPRLAQRMRIEIDRPSDVFPLSQLQAAAVLPQWESLPHWNAVRRNAAIAIITELAGAANIFRIPRWGASTLPALYKLAWLAPDESTRNAQLSRARLIGLPCGVPFPVFSGRNRATAEAARRPPISHALAMHREGIVMDHRALAAEPTEIIRRLRWVLDAAPGEDLENDIR